MSDCVLTPDLCQRVAEAVSTVPVGLGPVLMSLGLAVLVLVVWGPWWSAGLRDGRGRRIGWARLVAAVRRLLRRPPRS